MHQTTGAGIDCPNCGVRPPVPKHFAFRRCLFRAGPRSALSAHGVRATWYPCCGVFELTPAGFGQPQDEPLATYKPGKGWLHINNETGLGKHYAQYDPSDLAERMEILGTPPDEGRGPWPVRLCLHYVTNLVETVSHEMFSYWLATGGRGKPVVIGDATPFHLPSTCWPRERDRTQRYDDWVSVLRRALHDPETELPWVYQGWATTEPAVRGAFRAFLDSAFRPAPYEQREPMLLVCLRFNGRRWDREQAGRFLRLVLDNVRAKIVIQGVGAGKQGNAMPPTLPEGVVEASPEGDIVELYDAPISEQIHYAKRATYCVVPHGAAFLWSWISGAPTLEMMPQCKERLMTEFASLPMGADVKRLITNGAEWNADFTEPTAETVFEAMMEHAAESGAALE